MAQRLKLQALLEGILGSENVYFQPPNNLTMSYPAIVYNVGGLNNDYGDNLPYNQTIEWDITVIHSNSDNDIWLKIGALPMCVLTRTAVVDNLYHYYFTLYF